jgi:hypothetical protein
MNFCIRHKKVSQDPTNIQSIQNTETKDTKESKKTQNTILGMFSLQKRGEKFLYSTPDIPKISYEPEELFFDRAKNMWIVVPISKKN